MSTTPGVQSPNPVLIFDALTAYQKSFALKGAIELDLFTVIAEGASTVSAIARRCSASERGVRILCDYLVVAGMLKKTDGSYELSPDAAVFLNRRSPAYLGSIAHFLMHPDLKEAYSDIAATVRNGGTLLSAEGTVSQENPVWVDFARDMAPIAYPAAQEIAKKVLPASGTPPRRVLDMAAGHGLFGIAVASHYPDAQVVACDWPSVLTVATENATRAGVADRISHLPGDAMQVDLDGPYDLILITNFLHHFDPPTNENLLRRVRAALAEGGRAVTLEFVPNEDRVSPPTSAGFSLTMLASTRAGDAYTFNELEAMFRNAGFSRSELVQLQASPQQVVVSYA